MRKSHSFQDACHVIMNTVHVYFNKLGKEAFESKDKLTRTPESHLRVPAYPADYNSLLNDSLTHMPSPLSSTRVEAAGIDREEAQDLATRLFTENSGNCVSKYLKRLHPHRFH